MFLRPKKPALTLDMAPLIDVVFQLLIFFMLSSSFLNPALPLSLPRAAGEQREEPAAVTVTADEAGRIFINQEETSAGEFEARLAQVLATREEKVVNFRGERSMAYEIFVELMDQARRAGAQQFNIVHRVQEGR